MRQILFHTATVALVLNIAVAGAAEPDKELGACAAVENGVKRLECYDALAKKRGVTPAKAKAVEVASSGKWTTFKTTSKLDDSTNVTLRLEAEETIPNKLGLSRETPVLFISCRENTTLAYIDWGVFGINETSMTHRVDKQKAQTRTWAISTDYEAVGRWSGGSSIPFIKSLFGHNQLLTQITPYGASPVTVTFEISGLEQAIKPLREECNW